jgi:hypothetical protein
MINPAHFWETLLKAIDENRLVITIVTSQSKGKEASELISYGQGKSTFAIWCSHVLHGYVMGIRDKQFNIIKPELEDEAWYEALSHTTFFIQDAIKLIKSIAYNEKRRIPCLVIDDVERSAPAYQHIPKQLREAIEYLNVVRPYVANIIMTAPSISHIAKPLRGLVHYEVIIPRRGVYEVQLYMKRRDFYYPIDDRYRMIYLNTGTFPKMPTHIEQLYLYERDKHAHMELKEEEDTK